MNQVTSVRPSMTHRNILISKGYLIKKPNIITIFRHRTNLDKCYYWYQLLVKDGCNRDVHKLSLKERYTNDGQ
jgi:hypothetical protein